MNLDQVFLFRIGDIVAIKGSDQRPAKLADEWSPSPPRQRFLVLERVLQECHGGVQRTYVCRGILAHGTCSQDCLRLSEIELVASRPFSEEPND